MSLRLPKVPLIIAALLALAGAGVLGVKFFVDTEFSLVGIPGDLVGIGLLGFAFLVFALSFALATPVEKSEKPSKVKKEKKDKAAVAMLGEESEETVDEEYAAKHERKLAIRAEKAEKIAAKKRAKEEAIAAKEAKKAAKLAEQNESKENARLAKENAAAAKQAAKEQAIAAKQAIKEAKEAERKRKELEDEEDDEFARPAGEEYLKPLTKEEQDALKEEAELAKSKAKEEAAFVRNAQKQARVAAKLAAKEEKLRLAEEKKKAKEQLRLDKINAKLAAKEEKLRLAEEKKAAKLAAKEASIPVETEVEFVEPPVLDEVEEATVVEEVVEELDEAEDTVHEVSEYSDFEAPELSIPTEEEIYEDKDFVIPFSSPISSREAKMLQAELMKRIDELSDKVLTLENQLAEKTEN